MSERNGADLERRLAEVKDLQANADAAAGHVRSIFFFFLTYGLYLAVIVGATTHEQLLRASPVRLPILNVEIPLFGFYWIAPALFVLLHFNLLLQFLLLAQKLRLLRSLIPPGEKERQLTRLGSFAFSHMLIGEHHAWLFRSLFRLIIWTTVIILPIVLLLGVQVRFLPYHDADTTTTHRLLVLLDLLLLLMIWPQAVSGPARPADRRSLRQRLDAIVTVDDVRKVLSRPAPCVRDAAISLLAFLVGLSSLFLFTFPTDHDAIEADGNCAPPQEFGDPMETLLLDPDCLFAAVYPESWLVEETEWRVGDPEGWRPEPMLFRPTLWVLQRLPFVTRNLEVREASLVSAWPSNEQLAKFGEAEAWQNFGQSIVLRDRDVRYGRFADSTLAHADLRGADLRDADFEDADLQGARAEGVNLQGARLQGANLRSARLRRANLWDASLRDANLQGANLRDANLQGAALYADLQGATLQDADLQGAGLQGASLQGANLMAASLQGANLQGANLQGAVLWTANLRRADLGNANLQGAALGRASLEGADLRSADLQGAGLYHAGLWRVSLDGRTRFRLADLRRVSLNAPAPCFVTTWIEQAEREIVHEPTLSIVLDKFDQFKAWLGEDWHDRDALQALADRTDVLFDPVSPLAFRDFDPELAAFLGDIACAPDAPPQVAENVGWGARNISMGEEGRAYPGLIAKRLLGNACPSANQLSDDVVAALKAVLAD